VEIMPPDADADPLGVLPQVNIGTLNLMRNVESDGPEPNHPATRPWGDLRPLPSSIAAEHDS
jgi:hypothetical protein